MGLLQEAAEEEAARLGCEESAQWRSLLQPSLCPLAILIYD